MCCKGCTGNYFDDSFYITTWDVSRAIWEIHTDDIFCELDMSWVVETDIFPADSLNPKHFLKKLLKLIEVESRTNIGFVFPEILMGTNSFEFSKERGIEISPFVLWEVKRNIKIFRQFFDQFCASFKLYFRERRKVLVPTMPFWYENIFFFF